MTEPTTTTNVITGKHHSDVNVSLAMMLAVEVDLDEVIVLLEQQVKASFADWLREFEINPTAEVKAHFWTWAQDNGYTGRQLLGRTMAKYAREIGCRVDLD